MLDRPGCDAYLLYLLPPDVFVDKFELQQQKLSFSLYGHADLELPLSAVDDAPSVLEIKLPRSQLGETTVDIPLHARYPRPSTSPFSTVQIPEPEAFWVCPI